jgi:hypothetical protein
MLVFGILGLLLLGSIFAIIYGNKKYNDGLEVLGWIVGVSALIALIICVCALPWKRDIQYDIARYEELKREVQQVSKMSGKECDLTILAKKDLFEDVRIMNNYIDKNKTYHNSWWIGWFYSKEIGNLEKIDYLYE